MKMQLKDRIDAAMERLTPRVEEIGSVPVDAGKIEFSFCGSLAGAGALYIKTQEKTLGTAAIVFDGDRGAIQTPVGDGFHPVKVLHNGWNKQPLGVKWERFFMAIYPHDAATEMVLGDCGHIHLRVPLGESPCSVMFAWEDDGQTLWVVLR